MANGKAHCFRRGADQVNPIQKSKRELRIRLAYPPFKPTGSNDQPFDITERLAKNLDYLVEAGGQEFLGNTKDTGVVWVQAIPSGVNSATLTLFATVNGNKQKLWQLELVIADLDGATPLVAAKARLNNLGLFASETVDMTQDYATASLADNQLYNQAMRRFRALFGPEHCHDSPYHDDACWARTRVIHGS